MMQCKKMKQHKPRYQSPSWEALLTRTESTNSPSRQLDKHVGRVEANSELEPIMPSA